MSSTPPTERFVLLRDLNDAGGRWNAGISLVNETSTGRTAIRKSLPPSADKYNKEAAMMQKLTGHANIVQLYEFVPRSETSPNDELYMEYCRTQVGGREISTLGQLGIIHRSAAGTVLPEAFVWKILESLLKAICFMHYGVRDAGAQDVAPDQPVPDWVPAYHLDMHPDNIFLCSEPEANARLTYPRVVVGDFGGAILESELEGRVATGETSELSAGIFRGTDIDYLCSLLQNICHAPPTAEQRKTGNVFGDTLGTPGSWKYSEDLRRIVQDIYYNEQPNLLRVLAAVTRTKENLTNAGRLPFVPLTIL